MRLTLHRLHWRLVPVQTAILLTFALIPAWLKFEDAPRPFTATYSLGFVIVAPVIFSMAAWILAGFPGWRRLFRSKLALAWIIFLALLVVWSYFSQSWAFVETTRPGVAQNATLQLAFITGFCLVVICAGPPLRILTAVILAGALFSAIIGALQVAAQASIGLDFLGEFVLEPSRSGVSVIQSGELRWLRPYGLLPHPNILAGILMGGIFACISWILRPDARFRWMGAAALFGIGWVFLLTFSRGGWLALATGAFAILPFAARETFNNHALRQHLPILVGLALMSAAVFLLLYRPFLSARAGIEGESIELRSISDRAVYNSIALDAILTHPLVGIGGGNYPWYANDFLNRYTDFDLRGDNVHNVLLTVTAEYGFVGFALFLAALMTAVEAILRRIKANDQPLERIGLLGFVIAFLIVGMVEHYPWTLMITQVLWFGSMAAAVSPTDSG